MAKLRDPFLKPLKPLRFRKKRTLSELMHGIPKLYRDYTKDYRKRRNSRRNYLSVPFYSYLFRR